jgi:hypothetical protein
MTYPRYSVACENDDIQEFRRKAQALAYANKQAKLGRQHIVVNIQDNDGDLIDTIHITTA